MSAFEFFTKIWSQYTSHWATRWQLRNFFALEEFFFSIFLVNFSLIIFIHHMIKFFTLMIFTRTKKWRKYFRWRKFSQNFSLPITFCCQHVPVWKATEMLTKIFFHDTEISIHTIQPLYRSFCYSKLSSWHTRWKMKKRKVKKRLVGLEKWANLNIFTWNRMRVN